MLETLFSKMSFLVGLGLKSRAKCGIHSEMSYTLKTTVNYQGLVYLKKNRHHQKGVSSLNRVIKHPQENEIQMLILWRNPYGMSVFNDQENPKWT